MKVLLKDVSRLSLFYQDKQINIVKAELSSKLSKVIRFPEAIILVCRLPYIEWIKYDKSKNSLTYQFRNAKIHEKLFSGYEENYEQETLSEIHEEIEEIFEKYFW